MTRFSLNPERALSYAEHAVEHFYGHGPDGCRKHGQPGCRADLPALAGSYSPRDADQLDVTSALVAGAQEGPYHGVILGPGEIMFEGSRDQSGAGYRWLTRVGDLTLASHFTELRHAGDPDAAPGQDAAVKMLGEAVGQANRLLDDLAVYVAARNVRRPFDVFDPSFVGWCSTVDREIWAASEEPSAMGVIGALQKLGFTVVPPPDSRPVKMTAEAAAGMALNLFRNAGQDDPAPGVITRAAALLQGDPTLTHADLLDQIAMVAP